MRDPDAGDVHSGDPSQMPADPAADSAAVRADDARLDELATARITDDTEETFRLLAAQRREVHADSDRELIDADAALAAIGVPHFTTENLPIEGWREYRKKVTTRMVRIDGPFTVETREGPLTCPDGYLAVDACGYPYPIAADEHALIYGDPAVEPPVAAAVTVIACVAGLFGAGLGIALAYAVGFATATVVALGLMVAATLLATGALVRSRRWP